MNLNVARHAYAQPVKRAAFPSMAYPAETRNQANCARTVIWTTRTVQRFVAASGSIRSVRGDGDNLLQDRSSNDQPGDRFPRHETNLFFATVHSYMRREAKTQLRDVWQLLGQKGTLRDLEIMADRVLGDRE